MCFISIKATFTTSTIFNTNTKYLFFSITPTIDFSCNNSIVGDCIIEESGIINKGTVVSDPNTADFKIIFYDSILSGSIKTITCSLSYIN
jgi:hypothetical protein